MSQRKNCKWKVNKIQKWRIAEKEEKEIMCVVYFIHPTKVNNNKQCIFLTVKIIQNPTNQINPMEN